MGGMQFSYKIGEMKFQSMRKLSMSTLSPILKILAEGSSTTEAGSLFQYFTTLTENVDPLLRHLGIPCRDALLGRVEWEEGKTISDQYPKGP